jgi:hypothetical protein
MHKGMQVKSTEKVTSSGTSAQSAAFADNIYYVRVVADAACHIDLDQIQLQQQAKYMYQLMILNILKFHLVKKLLLLEL